LVEDRVTSDASARHRRRLLRNNRRRAADEPIGSDTARPDDHPSLAYVVLLAIFRDLLISEIEAQHGVIGMTEARTLQDLAGGQMIPFDREVDILGDVPIDDQSAIAADVIA